MLLHYHKYVWLQIHLFSFYMIWDLFLRLEELMFTLLKKIANVH